jgi:hypothetical protein
MTSIIITLIRFVSFEIIRIYLILFLNYVEARIIKSHGRTISVNSK